MGDQEGKWFSDLNVKYRRQLYRKYQFHVELIPIMDSSEINLCYYICLLRNNEKGTINLVIFLVNPFFWKWQ